MWSDGPCRHATAVPAVRPHGGTRHPAECSPLVIPSAARNPSTVYGSLTPFGMPNDKHVSGFGTAVPTPLRRPVASGTVAALKMTLPEHSPRFRIGIDAACPPPRSGPAMQCEPGRPPAWTPRRCSSPRERARRRQFTIQDPVFLYPLTPPARSPAYMYWYSVRFRIPLAKVRLYRTTSVSPLRVTVVFAASSVPYALRSFLPMPGATPPVQPPWALRM